MIRESGGDRSAVTGGTKVLSDRIVVRITAERGHTFIDRMITLVEGANRQKTPNEIALTILLAVLTIIFIPVVVTLVPFADFADASVSVVVLVALLVCLIPTTIGALLSAIGIAGMDRLVQRNVLAMSGRAVEAAGDVQTLLLDKTGTITLGNRMASTFYPVGGHTRAGSGGRRAAGLTRRRDARGPLDRGAGKGALRHSRASMEGDHVFVPFTATTRMSGLDIGTRQIRKGAGDSVKRWVAEQGGRSRRTSTPSSSVSRVLGRRHSSSPMARTLSGVIELKDVVKQGIREKFDEMRQMGIRTVMITGDNPLTAAAIAQEAGVDDFLAEATPEAKMALIKQEQEGGKLVAMTGDGTNDAPALAQADVGVAMNTGTTAAKEAGNMVDLDSNPTKLIDIVEIGKQLLITRGSLTTFSIANDIAKYFAIIPALFVVDVRLEEQPLEGTQHHASAQPPERGALGRDLQRAGHHRADTLGASRREVPRVQVVGDLAAQRLDLRSGWRHRAVHLHQTHRPRARRSARLLKGTDMLVHLRRSLVMAVICLVFFGFVYAFAGTGVSQLLFKHQADGRSRPTDRR